MFNTNLYKKPFDSPIQQWNNVKHLKGNYFIIYSLLTYGNERLNCGIQYFIISL